MCSTTIKWIRSNNSNSNSNNNIQRQGGSEKKYVRGVPLITSPADVGPIDRPIQCYFLLLHGHRRPPKKTKGTKQIFFFRFHVWGKASSQQFPGYIYVKVYLIMFVLRRSAYRHFRFYTFL
jgi:hypothetical protein